MTRWVKFLSKVFVVVFTTALLLPCETMGSNLPQVGGDIGEYGTWTTENNIALFTDAMNNDLTHMAEAFSHTQLAPNYVPIEAKLGLIFMNTMSWLGGVLERSLIPFISIFILIGFTFWIMLEVYNMMTQTHNTKQFAIGAVKNGALIAIWLIIMNMEPAKLFVDIMGPVLSLGTVFADLILNSVSAVVGVSLPDTCTAIREYTTGHIQSGMLLDANMAADIMCLPTRMSGLFYSAILVGFRWMIHGLGHSALTFFAGVLFVAIFVMNIWKFALMALGVIADLFLVVLMLPFTAIAETLGKLSFSSAKGTGIIQSFWNGFFRDLFKTQSLQSQIQRFIGAAIYFVILAVIIALCTALLSTTITPESVTQIPSLDNSEFMVTLITGCLVLYLANKADSYAKNWGGDINDSLGQQFGNDVIGLTKGAWNYGKGWYKAWREGS